MKRTMHHIIIVLLLVCSTLSAQEVPWKPSEVIQTQTLADQIKSKKTKNLVVLNVGPMENIRGAIRIGAVNYPEGEQNLRAKTNSIPRTKVLVVYCGCCSYANCPNIRPAYKVLKEAGFNQVLVLNLPEGIKPDWVAKEYPVD